MQEDIENKVVVLIENCSKLTASELRRALEKVLAQVKNGHGQKLPKQEKERENDSEGAGGKGQRDAEHRGQ